MTDARYHIVFSGQLVAGSDRATVEANLGRMLKVEGERLQALFSGRPVVLKKNADQATAMKLRAMLKQAGAQCEMRPVDAGQGATPPSSPAVSAPAEAAGAVEGETDKQMVGTIRTGGTGFSGPWQVAEVGAEIAPGDAEPGPEAPDISHLSMAEVGEDVLTEKPRKPTPVQVNIDHLSLSDEQ